MKKIVIGLSVVVILVALYFYIGSSKDSSAQVEPVLNFNSSALVNGSEVTLSLAEISRNFDSELISMNITINSKGVNYIGEIGGSAGLSEPLKSNGISIKSGLDSLSMIAVGTQNIDLKGQSLNLKYKFVEGFKEANFEIKGKYIINDGNNLYKDMIFVRPVIVLNNPQYKDISFESFKEILKQEEMKSLGKELSKGITEVETETQIKNEIVDENKSQVSKKKENIPVLPSTGPGLYIILFLMISFLGIFYKIKNA